MEEYLDGLSEVQREAVCYNSGPSQVVAGAGSGKTRVLTYKIAKLIEDGFKPSSILALTFTNKAAREMKSRISLLVGNDNSQRLWMGTFHSIFSRILRREADKLGFTSDFSIYNTSDSLSLIKSIIKESKLDDKVYSPKKVCSRISQMKNDLVSAESYRSRALFHDEDLKNRMPLFSELYTSYTERCKKANAMDFDDLLLYTNILFKEHKEVLAKYQNIFKFILVDEYQDTNYSQFLIVQKLAEKSHNVCVVGDDAQSIYSFRGARIENILNFQKNYPDCKVFKLEQNYRSSQNIVKVANDLIQKNEKQLKKNVFSEKQNGSPVVVMSSFSDEEEGVKIANKVKASVKSGDYSYSDFAVLYRTNAQSRIIEDMFRKNNIPYRIYGSTSFYEHKEILDVLAYFRFVINPRDEEALKRIINFPTRGIGETSLGKIKQCADENNLSIWNLIKDPLKYNLSINAGTLSKIAQFKDLIQSFIDDNEKGIDAYELAEKIIHDSGVWAKIHEDKSPENVSRCQNVEELLNGLCSSCSSKMETEGEVMTLSDFMAEVALMTSQDEDDTDTNKSTLMTVHSAKGLEFKNVFVIGVEEELFPSIMSSGSQDGIEEERRLFYVAITRAEENCCISYAKSRRRNGSFMTSNPSRFIRDINSDLLDFSEAKDFISMYSRFGLNTDKSQCTTDNRFNFKDRGTFAHRQIVENQIKTSAPKVPSRRIPLSSIGPTSNSGISDFKPGCRVEHEQFGFGVVETIKDMNTSAPKVVVNFENFGTKTLILKYAKMKIVPSATFSDISKNYIGKRVIHEVYGKGIVMKQKRSDESNEVWLLIHFEVGNAQAICSNDKKLKIL